MPSYPDATRAARTIDKHKTNIPYTMSTAIYAVMVESKTTMVGADDSSLHLLSSMDELINPKA